MANRQFKFLTYRLLQGKFLGVIEAFKKVVTSQGVQSFMNGFYMLCYIAVFADYMARLVTVAYDSKEAEGSLTENDQRRMAQTECGYIHEAFVSPVVHFRERFHRYNPFKALEEESERAALGENSAEFLTKLRTVIRENHQLLFRSTHDYGSIGRWDQGMHPPRLVATFLFSNFLE